MVSQLTLDFDTKKPAITATLVGSKWELTGETFMRRRTLLAAGGFWNFKFKTWEFADPLPEVVKECITEWVQQPAQVKSPSAVNEGQVGSAPPG